MYIVRDQTYSHYVGDISESSCWYLEREAFLPVTVEKKKFNWRGESLGGLHCIQTETLRAGGLPLIGRVPDGDIARRHHAPNQETTATST